MEGSQAGDSLVFFYSGHGSRERDKDHDEADGVDETLCPTDYETAGKIVDDEINAAIVRPLPYGSRIHHHWSFHREKPRLYIWGDDTPNHSEKG